MMVGLQVATWLGGHPQEKAQWQAGMGANGERGNLTQATRSHEFSFKVKAMAQGLSHFIITLQEIRNPKIANQVYSPFLPFFGN